ncbi:hypothetical protein VP01_1310g1 [Puccinia sorghi]|uniref:Uncharacterized protein n=1 Tax=Puccinia sorghi TaxID=27349 RepID=A0A0L6VMV6_9BASI|nr:hypothetical protein VP01_1310g1 [Puccinia sorghi]
MFRVHDYKTDITKRTQQTSFILRQYHTREDFVRILTMPQMTFLIFSSCPLLNVVFILVPIGNTTPPGSEPISLRLALLKLLSFLILVPEHTLLLISSSSFFSDPIHSKKSSFPLLSLNHETPYPLPLILFYIHLKHSLKFCSTSNHYHRFHLPFSCFSCWARYFLIAIFFLFEQIQSSPSSCNQLTRIQNPRIPESRSFFLSPEQSIKSDFLEHLLAKCYDPVTPSGTRQGFPNWVIISSPRTFVYPPQSTTSITTQTELTLQIIDKDCKKMQQILLYITESCFDDCILFNIQESKSMCHTHMRTQPAYHNLHNLKVERRHKQVRFFGTVLTQTGTCFSSPFNSLTCPKILGFLSLIWSKKKLFRLEQKLLYLLFLFLQELLEQYVRHQGTLLRFGFADCAACGQPNSTLTQISLVLESSQSGWADRGAQYFTFLECSKLFVRMLPIRIYHGAPIRCVLSCRGIRIRSSLPSSLSLLNQLIGLREQNRSSWPDEEINIQGRRICAPISCNLAPMQLHRSRLDEYQCNAEGYLICTCFIAPAFKGPVLVLDEMWGEISCRHNTKRERVQN